MANMWAVIFTLFLIAHGIVGVAMFAGSPAGKTRSWPSSKSWLLGAVRVSESHQRTFAIALMSIAAIALIAGALGVVGVPGLVGIWDWLVVVGAAFSLITLVLYFSPWWLGGIAINTALIVAILVLDWPTDQALGI